MNNNNKKSNNNHVINDGIGQCEYNEKDNTFTIIDDKGKQFPGGFVAVAMEADDDAAAAADDERKKKSKADEVIIGGNEVNKDNKEEENDATDNEKINNNNTETKDDDPNEKPKPIAPREQLFIEEVLFQQERGLLRVLTSTNKKEELSTQDLYKLLPKCNVSLASYLVYAHLKSQTYVVLRHTEDRLRIVLEIEKAANAVGNTDDKDVNDENDDASKNEKENLKDEESNNTNETDDNDANNKSTNATSATNDDFNNEEKEKLEKEESNSTNNETNDNNETNNKSTTANTTDTTKQPSSLWRKRKKSQSIRSLTHQLRINASHAPPPSSTILLYPPPKKKKPIIAYDVYNPNANFRKSNPGPPHFYVAITAFGTPSPKFEVLQDLLKDACCGIPLRVATVADDGCVIMFGLTDYGVPSLLLPNGDDNDNDK